MKPLDYEVKTNNPRCAAPHSWVLPSEYSKISDVPGTTVNQIHATTYAVYRCWRRTVRGFTVYLTNEFSSYYIYKHS